MSVLDGAICSSGISSPVAGSRYWTKLWWDSSVSSSIRMPVWRRTSTAAQVQNAWCSSRVRSRRLPVPGSSAQVLPLMRAWSRWPAQRLPGGGEQLRRGGGLGGVQPLGGCLPGGVDGGQQDGQDRHAFAGALVHP